MALVNRYILVEYDVGGPRLWHERWALEHVGGDSYIVVTPDRDIYSEDLGLLNSDLRPAPGVVPPGVNAAEIYALPMWNVGEMQAIRDEARQVALQERQAAGAPAAQAVPVAAVGVAALPAVAAWAPCACWCGTPCLRCLEMDGG